jgi:hypothetical protein
VGTLWGRDGGKKVPPRRGGAGMGDGAGITRQGPQTHPIAIPRPDLPRTALLDTDFTHPIEVAGQGRGKTFAPITGAGQ